MRSETIQDLKSFLTVVALEAGTVSLDRIAAYRGHRDIKWKLVPSIARHPFKAPEAFHRDHTKSWCAERSLYLFFRDFSASMMPEWVSQGTGKEISWRKLVVAQHHGVPTRLLDWSTNPLVGLFFSVEGKPEPCEDPDPKTCQYCSGDGMHDSAVYLLKDRRGFTVAGLAASDRNDEAPFYAYDEEVGVLWAPHISPRIGAQGSLFTIRKDPGKPIDPDLTIRIPNSRRASILRELDTLNVNRRTLFPDMDGLADYLKWACQFWDPSRGVSQG
jgi:hypothetical protein